MYEALRWPLPSLASEERQSGRALTAYLLRATSDPAFRLMPSTYRSRGGEAPMNGRHGASHSAALESSESEVADDAAGEDTIAEEAEEPSGSSE